MASLSLLFSQHQIHSESNSTEKWWYIVVRDGITGRHNHELAVYPELHRQISGLSHGAKKLVRDMTDAQTKPANILAAVKENFPEDHANARHIYNCRDQYKRESSDGRNPAQQLLHQAVQHQYVHWLLTDEGDAVTHVFLAHPTSVSLLRTYPYVINMDATYKTNRYKYPLIEMVGMTPCGQNFMVGWALVKDETQFSYQWVLHCLKYLLGDDTHPIVIVTDRELGLMAPVRDIFPCSAHLLCTYYLAH